MNFFFALANRHDSDRVELQLGFDGEMQSEKSCEYEVNIQFMFPKSLGLSENFDKEALRAQLQSHLRLHTHASNPQNPTKLTRVRERLELLLHQLSEESLKFFALEIEAFLKYEIKILKKQIREMRALPNNDELFDQLLQTRDLIEEYRKLLTQRHLYGKSARDFPFDSFDHDLMLLDEYISHLYVSLLSHLRFYCERTNDSPHLLDTIPNLTKKEADHRRGLGYFLQTDDKKNAEAEEEHYLRRASMLKKYFQKILFVRADQTSRENRLLVPVYGLSAGFAVSFAIAFQNYFTNNSKGEMIGINTVAVLSVAIFAYVIREILKDYFKKFFYKRSQKYFPDYRVKLSFIHKNIRKPLGTVNEFIRLSSISELPSVVRELRFSDKDFDLEPEVGEDVVEYKKVYNLKLKSLELREHYHWGIREVLRIRVDRFTTSMDDPTKMLHLLRQDGSIESHLGHRVYFMHMAVSIRPLNSFVSNDLGTLKLFRVKMDKTGILSVESIKKIAVEEDLSSMTGK